MKKVFFLVLILALSSCGVKENINSRLTIDTYSKKLNAIIDNIVTGRAEEDSQTGLTLDSLFQNYISEIERFSNTLGSEVISPRYLRFKEELLIIAKDVLAYLHYRERAINDLYGYYSSYNSLMRNSLDIKEFKAERYSGYYSGDSDTKLMKESVAKLQKDLENLTLQKLSLMRDFNLIDSISLKLFRTTGEYNLSIEGSKLDDTIRLPLLLKDTINDWLYTNRASLNDLELPSPE
jgi:hypothetical protein